MSSNSRVSTVSYVFRSQEKIKPKKTAKTTTKEEKESLGGQIKFWLILSFQLNPIQRLQNVFVSKPLGCHQKRDLHSKKSRETSNVKIINTLRRDRS